MVLLNLSNILIIVNFLRGIFISLGLFLGFGGGFMVLYFEYKSTTAVINDTIDYLVPQR